jgi:hypothetical protein
MLLQQRLPPSIGLQGKRLISSSRSAVLQQSQRSNGAAVVVASAASSAAAPAAFAARWRAAPPPPTAAAWITGLTLPFGSSSRGISGSTACRSTASPQGISWLASVEFGAPLSASSNGSAAGQRFAGLDGSSTSGAAADGTSTRRPSAAAALAALQREPPLDAVVMLAGGLHPDGGLPDWVSRRLDTAHDLAKLQQQRCPVLMLGG